LQARKGFFMIMLSLFALLVIPIIFISFILLVSILPNNLNSNWNINNNLSLVIYQGKYNRTFWSNIWKNNIKKNNRDHKVYKYSIYKRLGMILSLILYLLIIIYWLKYNRTTINYQLLTVPGNDYIWNLDISLGLDGISLPFILLVGFIMPLVFLSNWSTIDSLDIYYVIIIILLELFLIVVFLVLDLIMFYIFFESTLPLLFILIGLYGASQKFRAGFYIFLYTLFGSLFMLLVFVKISADSGSTFFENYNIINVFQSFQDLIWLILLISFAAKTPLIPVHIWLPLAHSDANVSGSIILASIVLKLALYAFIRVSIGIFYFATAHLIPFFLGICCISVVYSSLTTIRQFDLKVLVAYSSIAHMSTTLLGTFSDTLLGLIGSIIFGLAHGFVSPGLFFVVGAVLYDRCGSRVINYYRGLTVLLPFLSLLFLILIFGNCGVPLTANFLGEFLCLLGAYQQNIFITSIAATSIVLSAVYSIFMYNRTTSGSYSKYLHTIPDIFRKEYYLLLPLIILTIIIGVYPYFIIVDIEFALSNYLLSNGYFLLHLFPSFYFL
jgi:NADH-ubiquinone oxidoreductase chain 4